MTLGGNGVRAIRILLSLAMLLAAARSRGADSPTDEWMDGPAGARVDGRLRGDGRAGFRFLARGGAAPAMVPAGSVFRFNSPVSEETASPPPFRALIGESLRLSGTLRGLSTSALRVGVSWQKDEIVLPRPGVLAIEQRHGEARLWSDPFESFDPSRWTTGGKPTLVERPRLNDGHSLRLPAEGSSIGRTLLEPLLAGRFELAFHGDATVAPGQQWYAELTFRGPNGAQQIRVHFGWSEDNLAVESPSGPSLQVQRLVRSNGWHRLSIRFGPEQTEISVDGKELAHGKGPEGPLVSVRIASGPTGKQAPPANLAGHVDDLQLVRFAEPPASLETDVTQDEARLVVGDQLYGQIHEADTDKITMTIEGKAITLPWSEVAGLYFRRLPRQSATTAGVQARVEWRSVPGEEPADLDFAEGAIVAITDDALAIATPYSGLLKIPHDRLRKLILLGEGTRLVVDAAAHHLGDEVSVTPPLFDPQLPEGGILERTFELTTVPAEVPAFVVMDVVQVVGENNDSDYSDSIKRGELKTYVAVNGQRIDYLNRHIKTRNDTPERIAVQIPAGLLHPGKNKIQLELTGMAAKPNQLDDLGVLQIAIEFTATPTRYHVPAIVAAP